MCPLHLKISRRRLIALLLFCTALAIASHCKYNARLLLLPASELESHDPHFQGIIDARQWLETQNLTVAGTIPCRWTTVDDLQFPICAYNESEDIYVSAAVHSGKVFEQNVVERVVRLIRTELRETMQLVDIGANIGSYTLPVSQITCVIAVEPNWETMSRLAMSVVLGNVERNVTLVHSAVDNQRTVINMAYDPANRGVTVVSKNASCAGVSRKGLHCLKRPIKAVLFDDLLPLMRHRRAVLKVDVEGHEINVFTEETAAAFFQAIDVPLILMEWGVLLGLSRNEPKYVQRIERLLTFFGRRDYRFFDHNNRLLLSHWKHWPTDIILKKRQYIRELF